jgi:ribosome-binding factor A
VSVVGQEPEREEKLRWLRSHSRDIREALGRRIVLKYMPRFEYVADHSVETGTRILRALDEIGPPEPHADATPE